MFSCVIRNPGLWNPASNIKMNLDPSTWKPESTAWNSNLIYTRKKNWHGTPNFWHRASFTRAGGSLGTPKIWDRYVYTSKIAVPIFLARVNRVSECKTFSWIPLNGTRC